ncbi:MAG: hypothetical protein ACREXS_21445 [Gammaproteobacteria bacterium]
MDREQKARTNLVFFLGGADLEMATIRALLDETVPDSVHDKGLRWGAKASAYREEIMGALAQGLTPVLVELEDDLGLGSPYLIIVDHHGPEAGADKLTSLHQVFDLLELPPERWIRWYDLVAANDRGYIPEMLELGATQAEIIQVRAADRAAQGITSEDEQAGQKAASQAETVADGRLTIVRLPHNRTAAVTDRLDPALGGRGFQNLLVQSPEEVNFYGDGKFVMALATRFPSGWYGGALPERGFWGRMGAGADVEASLIEYLSSDATVTTERVKRGVQMR